MEKRAVGAGSQTPGAVPPRIARLGARFKRARTSIPARRARIRHQNACEARARVARDGATPPRAPRANPNPQFRSKCTICETLCLC